MVKINDVKRIIKKGLILFLLILIYGCDRQTQVHNQILLTPYPLTATPAITNVFGQTRSTPLLVETNTQTAFNTPTIFLTPTIVPDKVNVEWESMLSLSPNYYILYQNNRNNNLYILSQDGTKNEKIITGRENWQTVYYWVDQYNRTILHIEIDYSVYQYAFNFVTHQKVPLVPKMAYPELFACSDYGISRDQKWGIFVCGGDERYIVLKNADSGRILKVQNTKYDNGRSEDYRSIFWSPDNRWIAYFREKEKSTYDYAGLMLVDTTCLNQPDNCPLKKFGPFSSINAPTSILSPCMWSPDSRLFTTATSINALPLLTFNPLDKVFHKIQAHNGNFTVESMAWSPDNNWISFSENTTVYLLSKNGGTVKPIFQGNDEVRVIGWVSTYPDPIFEIGHKLFVTGAGDLLQIHQAAGLKSLIVATLNAGADVEILEGPQEIDGEKWWKIKTTPGGSIGWVVENPDWFATR